MLNDIRVKLNTWCISRDNSFGKSKLNWTFGLALFCLDTAEITIIMAIGGGSGVKKTCQAYFEELIAVVSTLFTECQNSTPFQRYDQFNFEGLDFHIGTKG